MSIPNKRYEIYRGDASSFGFLVTDSAGTPVNITGWSAKFIGKLAITDTDASAIFNIAATVQTQTITANLGIVLATITNAMTLALPSTATVIYYNWQFTDTSGAIHTLEKGTIVVQPDMTIST